MKPLYFIKIHKVGKGFVQHVVWFETFTSIKISPLYPPNPPIGILAQKCLQIDRTVSVSPVPWWYYLVRSCRVIYLPENFLLV